MICSSDVFLCLEGLFHKRRITDPVLSYCKHALDLCLLTSYSMTRSESDCGRLLSVLCAIAQGTILWYNDIYIHRPYTHKDATLANQRTCVHRYRNLSVNHCKHNLSQEHLLKPWNYQQLASSVQFENHLASPLYSVGFILPGSRSPNGLHHP